MCATPRRQSGMPHRGRRIGDRAHRAFGFARLRNLGRAWTRPNRRSQRSGCSEGKSRVGGEGLFRDGGGQQFHRRYGAVRGAKMIGTHCAPRDASTPGSGIGRPGSANVRSRGRAAPANFSRSAEVEGRRGGNQGDTCLRRAAPSLRCRPRGVPTEGSPQRSEGSSAGGERRPGPATGSQPDRRDANDHAAPHIKSQTPASPAASPRSIKPIKRSMLGCLPGFVRASSVCSA